MKRIGWLFGGMALLPRDKCFWLKMVLGLLVLAAVLNAMAITAADPDLWGYMAFGRLFWEDLTFPYQDVFSYVPTLKPWVYHEWLTGVIFFPLYHALGGTGLQLLKFILGLVTLGLILATAMRRGADLGSAALGLWIIQLFLAFGYSPVRAQVFTFFFFALALYLLETARLTGHFRRLLLLPIILVPWCNLHGGFMAGLGLIALYALGEVLCRRPFRPYLGTFLLSGLATLINPYGLAYWTYIWRAVTMPRPTITEWSSIIGAYQSGLYTENLIFFAAILIFTVFLIIWARWKEITPGVVLALTLYLGLKHQRHLVFFLIALGAYLPILIKKYFEVLRSQPLIVSLSRRLGYAIPIIVLAIATASYTYKFLGKSPLSLNIPITLDRKKQVMIYYPVGAVRYIEEHRLSGNLLTEFDWGEYLLWSLYPQCRVAPDGRFETVYPEEVFQKYWNFKYGCPLWREIIQAYPPDMILVDKKSAPYRLLRQEGEWRQVYEDADTALFRRVQQDRLAIPGVPTRTDLTISQR